MDIPGASKVAAGRKDSAQHPGTSGILAGQLGRSLQVWVMGETMLNILPPDAHVNFTGLMQLHKPTAEQYIYNACCCNM